MQCEKLEIPEKYEDGFFEGLFDFVKAKEQLSDKQMLGDSEKNNIGDPDSEDFPNNSQPIINELNDGNKIDNEESTLFNSSKNIEDLNLFQKVLFRYQNKVDNFSNVREREDELAFLKEFQEDDTQMDQEFVKYFNFEPNKDGIFENIETFNHIMDDSLIQNIIQENSM